MSAIADIALKPLLIVVRLVFEAVVVFVCSQRILVGSKTLVSLHLLTPEVTRHGKTVPLLYRTSVFLTRKARHFLGSPKPGSPSSVRCSFRVCGSPVVATSLRRRESNSPEKSNLSILMRGGRVYHGGVWRVSIGTVQLYGKQSDRIQLMSNERSVITRECRLCGRLSRKE
jgi:hypothetical protein